MPTAMPDEPLISRLGTRVGQDLRLHLAVVVVGPEIDGFLVDILQQRRGDRDSRASVYRMAAGGSPSTEPKLPCPSISG